MAPIDDAPADDTSAGGLTAAEILAYLDSRSSRPRPADHLRAYREAAAVLASISDLAALRPAGTAPLGRAAELLLDQSVHSYLGRCLTFKRRACTNPSGWAVLKTLGSSGLRATHCTRAAWHAYSVHHPKHLT